MSIAQDNVDAFERAVATRFEFLEGEFGLSYVGTEAVQEDPRDSYIAARYGTGDFRVEVVWNPVAMSLVVLVRLSNVALGRRERTVYFEPFVEFVSEGAIIPVAPQVYPGMSIGRIEKTMQARESLFVHGINGALDAIADKLKAYLPCLDGSSEEVVRAYHEWYKSRG